MSSKSKTVFAKAKDYATSYTKKRYTNKKGNIDVGKITGDVAKLAKLLNVETKQVDTLATAITVLPTASQIYGVGTVSQGSAGNQRSGDSK